MNTTVSPELVSPEPELVTLTLLTTARHLSRDARLDALIATAIEHGTNLATAAGADRDQIAAALVGYDDQPDRVADTPTIHPGPCELGPVTPGNIIAGRCRVRAVCSCGTVLTAWTTTRLDGQFTEHQAIERPPADVLDRAPTKQDVRDWPDFYISGPGRAVASRTACPHDYRVTDSCPGCDYDQEQAANEPDPDHGLDIIRDRENGL